MQAEAYPLRKENTVAQRVHIVLEDDLDGSTADETVSFGLDGASYEIDLSKKNAVEGYHVHVGGGFGPDAAIAPEIYHDVKAEDVPRVVERMLKAYLAHRASPQESFQTFTRRHDIDALRALIDSEAAQ